jgi:hypothetical protein
VHPFSAPLLLRKCGSAGNRTRTARSVARNSDHKTTDAIYFYITYINSVRTSQETQYISVLQPGTLTTRPQTTSSVLLYDLIPSIKYTSVSLFMI